MALTPQKVEDLDQNFKVVNPARNGDHEDLIIRSKEEYLLLIKSRSAREGYGAPMRHRGQTTSASRFFYQGSQMFDLRSSFKKYLVRNIGGIKIPRYIQPKHLHLSRCTKGEGSGYTKPWITAVERCAVNGVVPYAHEIVSVGQAIYVFDQMKNSLPISMDVFNEKLNEGPKWYDFKKTPTSEPTPEPVIEVNIGEIDYPASQEVGELDYPTLQTMLPDDIARRIDVNNLESSVIERLDIIIELLRQRSSVTKDSSFGEIAFYIPESDPFDQGANLLDMKFVIMLFDKLDYYVNELHYKEAKAYSEVCKDMRILNSDFSSERLKFLERNPKIKSGFNEENLKYYYKRLFMRDESGKVVKRPKKDGDE